MNKLVLREDRDGVATLTLNRPEALNAMSPSMFVELRAHLDAIARETEAVGCVVLQGAGKSFSAGNDIKAILAGDRAPSPHFQAETIDALEARFGSMAVARAQGCVTEHAQAAARTEGMAAVETAQETLQ